MRTRRDPARSLRSPAQRIGRRLVWLTLLLLAAGCDRSAPQADDSASANTPRPGRGVVAFVGAGEGDPLWPLLKSSAERHAESSISTEVRFINPSGRSPQDQVDCLRSLREPNLRALCVQVTDAEALTPILSQLHNRGILIVSMIQAAPREVRAGHVGFDDRAIGKALAEATGQALDGAGSIAILHAGLEHTTSDRRRSAFEEEMPRYADIAIFARKDCHGDPRQARELIRSYAERFPRLSAWVAMEDWPLRNRGLEELPFPPACTFITFGGTPNQWPLIENRTCAAVVGANYGELGAKAVQFCESALRRQPRFELRYDAELRIIWPTNLAEYKRDWVYWSTGSFPERERDS